MAQAQDEYSTPIPQDAVIGQPPMSQSQAQNQSQTVSAQSTQSATQPDEYNTPIPQGAVIGQSSQPSGDSGSNPKMTADEQMFLKNNPTGYQYLSRDPKFPNRPEGIYPTGSGNEWRQNPDYTQNPVDPKFWQHTAHGAIESAVDIGTLPAGPVEDLSESVLNYLRHIPAVERLAQASKLMSLADKHPAIATIIRSGLRGSAEGAAIGGATDGKEGAKQGAVLGGALGTAGATLREVMPSLSRVSHVFDPESKTIVPVSDIAAERAGTRPTTGAAIQQAADENLKAVGRHLDVAKASARATLIPEVPSENFVKTMNGISVEANTPTLESIPSDEMKNVKAVADEIAAKQTLTHDEFEGYSKQLGDRIDDLKTTKTDKSARRLYIKAKQALQNEYYDQLAVADPKVSQGLQQVNRQYANLNKQINEGPAKTLFHAAAPEQIVKRIVSGSVTESQIDPILKAAEDYDTANPNSPLGSIKDYLRKGTLYNQMVKFGQRTENGLITRLDPVAMISDLDKNPVYKEIYGDAYEDIRNSLIDEAKNQARRRMLVEGGAKVAKGTLKTGAYTLMGLGGLQMLGVPVVQTLWSLLKRSSAPTVTPESTTLER